MTDQLIDIRVKLEMDQHIAPVLNDLHGMLTSLEWPPEAIDEMIEGIFKMLILSWVNGQAETLKAQQERLIERQGH